MEGSHFANTLKLKVGLDAVPFVFANADLSVLRQLFNVSITERFCLHLTFSQNLVLMLKVSFSDKLEKLKTLQENLT